VGSQPPKTETICSPERRGPGRLPAAQRTAQERRWERSCAPMRHQNLQPSRGGSRAPRVLAATHPRQAPRAVCLTAMRQRCSKMEASACRWLSRVSGRRRRVCAPANVADRRVGARPSIPVHGAGTILVIRYRQRLRVRLLKVFEGPSQQAAEFSRRGGRPPMPASATLCVDPKARQLTNHSATSDNRPSLSAGGWGEGSQRTTQKVPRHTRGRCPRYLWGLPRGLRSSNLPRPALGERRETCTGRERRARGNRMEGNRRDSLTS
jgi:hypothetical protein